MPSLTKIVNAAVLVTLVFAIYGCGTALRAIVPDYTYVGGNESSKKDANGKIIKNLSARYFAQSPGNYITTPYTGTKILVDTILSILPVPPIMELDRVRFTIYGITENDVATLKEIKEANYNVIISSLDMETTITVVTIHAFGGNFSKKEVRLLFDMFQKRLGLQLSGQAQKTYKEIFGRPVK